MNTITEQTALIEKICTFLAGIGIETKSSLLQDPDCFLPGLKIESGCILIDPQKLLYPGDIIHEAGHIAVVGPEERPLLQGKEIENRPERAAEEMAAIAWSYAACRAMQLDPLIIFHENGYKGGGENIAESFNNGNYFGVPILQWHGMSAEPHMAERLGIKAFPQMEKWLRG